MKTKLFLFNPIVWVCLIMGITTQAQNPFCEDFNSYATTSPVGTLCDAVCHPNLLNNWGGFNIDGIHYTDIGSQGGPGDNFLYLDDGSCGNGATFAYNDADFNGNWVAMVPQEEGCFCFDMKSFFIQTGTVTGFNSLRIQDGPDLCSSTFSAVFVISTPIDVSLGWQRVCAPIALSSGGILPSNTDGQWVVNTGNASDWDSLITNVNSISFAVDVAGGDERWGIDNICISDVCDADIGQGQPTEDGSYCCEGEKNGNLVTNGNFEFGDTGFSSDYSQSTGTFPGEYDVVTSASAFGANVTDHSFCDDPSAYATNDMYMVVNGKTQQAGSSIIWEQNIVGLEEGKEYKFCANFKDMEQCTFNILPTITMSAGFNTVMQIIDTDDTNPCDWERLEICFIAEGPKMNFKIELDETGNGDGNDLAIDDIAVQEKLDPEYFITVQHQGDTNAITGSLNTIATTDDILLNEECVDSQSDSYYWFVYEPIDPNNPNLPLGGNITPGTFAWANDINFGGISTSTWDLTTMFPSYSFNQNTFYVIGMWIPSCCESCYTESWEYQITYNHGLFPSTNQEFSKGAKEEIKAKLIKNSLGVSRKTEQINSKIELFPNPASHSFEVSLLKDSIQKIDIISISGQIVLTKNMPEVKNEAFVDISSLSAGMYFVNVLGENNQRYTVKLIKE